MTKHELQRTTQLARDQVSKRHVISTDSASANSAVARVQYQMVRQAEAGQWNVSIDLDEHLESHLAELMMCFAEYAPKQQDRGYGRSALILSWE